MSVVELMFSSHIRQCGEDGEERTWRRPELFVDRCGYCGKVIKHSPDAMLMVISDTANTVTNPGERARGILSHIDCGPGTGYAINLTDLAFNGDQNQCSSYDGWVNHLRGKVWFNHDVWEGLDTARALALKLKPKPEPPPMTRSAIGSIPSRPSPVSSNARSISTRTRTRIMERDNFTCRRCGHKAPDVRLVVDHVIAVAKGGTADESNLQTLCWTCNAGKSDRDPHAHDLGANV